MKNIIITGALLLSTTLLMLSFKSTDVPVKGGTLLKDVTLIDGNGGKPQEHMDILIQGLL